MQTSWFELLSDMVTVTASVVELPGSMLAPNPDAGVPADAANQVCRQPTKGVPLCVMLPEPSTSTVAARLAASIAWSPLALFVTVKVTTELPWSGYMDPTADPVLATLHVDVLPTVAVPVPAPEAVKYA